MSSTEKKKHSADTASREFQKASQQSHCQRETAQAPSAKAYLLSSLTSCSVMKEELKHDKYDLRKSMESQAKPGMQCSAGTPEVSRAPQVRVIWRPLSHEWATAVSKTCHSDPSPENRSLSDKSNPSDLHLYFKCLQREPTVPLMWLLVPFPDRAPSVDCFSDLIHFISRHSRTDNSIGFLVLVGSK